MYQPGSAKKILSMRERLLVALLQCEGRSEPISMSCEMSGAQSSDEFRSLERST